MQDSTQTMRQFSDSESDGTTSPRSPSSKPSGDFHFKSSVPSTPTGGISQAREAKDYLRVSCVDYFCEGTGHQYNHHFYVIDIHVEELHWQVDRCILDFVELDRKLRKRYPRCTFMNLPISEQSLSQLYIDLEKNEKSLIAIRDSLAAGDKSINTSVIDYADQPLDTTGRSRSSKSAGNGSNNNTTTTSGGGVTSSIFNVAEGWLGGWGGSARSRSSSYSSIDKTGNGNGNSNRNNSVASLLEVNSVDHMCNKVDALNKYLISLMNQHELLVSDELCLFLDQEASTMSVQIRSIEPLSLHDILLLSNFKKTNLE